MKAYSSASGGVIFVPEDIERKPNSISYKEFLKQEQAEKKVGVFGKKKVKTEKRRAQAA